MPGKIISQKSGCNIQGKPFFIGLTIKNINETPFLGCSINNLRLESAENKSLVKTFSETLEVRLLNPNEQIKIWWPNAVSIDLYGLVWINCSLSPKTQGDQIFTYQKDEITGTEEKYDYANQWGDSLYFKSAFENEQIKTNRLLLILTILMFLDAVLGLKNVAIWCLELLRSIFMFLVNILDKVIH
jgi:hypothetical protein